MPGKCPVSIYRQPPGMAHLNRSPKIYPMKNTLAQATQIAPKRLAILVDAGLAQSLYNSLQKQNVQCLPPSEAIFKRKRAYIDAEGRRQVEEEAVVSEIIASGTLDDFPKWMGEWILPTS